MSRRLQTFAPLALLALALAGPTPSLAATGVAPARDFAPRQVILKFEGQRASRAVTLPASVGVREAVSALRRSPRVAYAAPNFLASASAEAPFAAGSAIPNDPGPIDGIPGLPGGWVTLQWNLLPWTGIPTATLPVSAGGIDAVGAWQNLAAVGRRGASGTVVAVLDTGIAYRAFGKRFRRSPDFTPDQFVDGYDFVAGDRLPLDQNGHGTHIAGTIAEKTDNGIGLVGLAYRARLMPVRVLDRHGSGQADDIARGIRFAVANGADVINMSFNFGCGKNLPGIDEALRRAYRAGIVTVASIGNLGAETCVAPPATGPRVLGVGGTTEGGCLGAYSLTGKGIDVLAPGGGTPIRACPSVWSRTIYQVTLKAGDPLRFGEPGTYVGTSMAAAHVSALAAMVLASGVLEPLGSPGSTVNRVARRLRNTARDLGLPPRRQGAGLIDAAGATAPIE